MRRLPRFRTLRYISCQYLNWRQSRHMRACSHRVNVSSARIRSFFTVARLALEAAKSIGDGTVTTSLPRRGAAIPLIMPPREVPAQGQPGYRMLAVVVAAKML